MVIFNKKISFFKLIIILCAAFCSTLATGENITINTKQEVSYLFSYLEKSDCEFNRNGNWYNAKEASKHLHEKYEYLVNRDLIVSTENFIDRAATKSSISGKSYQVRCGKNEIVDSNIWFNAALKKYRSAAHVTQ